MKPYQEKFPVGTTVRIAERAELERFQREWQFHHKLELEQLSCAGRTARVRDVGFYHGGDVLYHLEVFPVFGTRSVFALPNDSIRTI